MTRREGGVCVHFRKFSEKFCLKKHHILIENTYDLFSDDKIRLNVCGWFPYFNFVQVTRSVKTFKETKLITYRSEYCGTYPRLLSV